jgi:hypothetical protein
MIDHQGGRRSVERFFVERESSWRESLHGETLSMDRLLRGEKVFVEKLSP